MDPATILADVGSVLQIATLALQAAENAAPFVETALGLIQSGQGLTDAQRAALLEQESILRGQLNS